MRNIKRNEEGIIGIIALIIIICLVIVVAFIWFQQANDRYTITGTVEKKWIDYGDDTSHYLLRILLPGGQKKMLEVNRNILHGSNYNPDLIYPDIELNKTYMFTCWGWDWQWEDNYWYPNVIEAREI